MLTALEWNLWNSLRLCGGRTMRTVWTNLFSTEVTSTLKNVLICLWHNVQSSSSTGGTRGIRLNFSCANDPPTLIDKWLMVEHLTWFSFWFCLTITVCASLLRPSKQKEQELIFTCSSKMRWRMKPARRSRAPLRCWASRPFQQQNSILISSVGERAC